VTTQVSLYQKGKTNLHFTEARDSEWQWNLLGRMQVCTSLQTDNYASTPPLSFFTGRMPFLPPKQQRQSTEVLCIPSPQSHLNLLQGTKCKKQKKLQILITKTGMLRRNKVK